MRVAIIGCSHTFVDDIQPSWTRFYAEQNPRIQIDNYAHFGHGHLYMDMVLKYLLYENKSYDRIVVQMTGDKRWHAAIEADIGYNWIAQKITDNLNRIYLDTPRIVYNTVDKKNHVKIPGSIHQNGSIIPQNKLNQYKPGPWNLAQYYSQLFEKQIQTIDNLSYFHFKDVKVAFIEKYGEEYLLTHLMDETLHFNKYGHQLFYEYLVKSNILPLIQ
jgi:hypothetical protein